MTASSSLSVTPELTETEAIRVAAVGFDKPMGFEAMTMACMRLVETIRRIRKSRGEDVVTTPYYFAARPISPGRGYVWCEPCKGWYPPKSAHASLALLPASERTETK